MGIIVSGNLGDDLKTHRISSINSTTSILGAGASFTGAWEDVEKYSTAAVSISGNLSAEPGTLFFELSHDGSTIHATISVNIPNNVLFDKPHILNIIEKYIRIKYTNGATPQTVFNLQTKYSNAQPLGLLNTIGEDIYDESEGIIVRSVLAGKNPSGTYENVGVSEGGALTVSNFLTEVALDHIDRHSEVIKFGYVDGVSSGTTPRDIWNGTGDYTGQPLATNETVDIVSTDSDDTSAGSGAQGLHIFGLDAAGLLQDEVIATNGTTNVTSVGTYSRVFRARVTGPNSNQGVITVAHTTTTANVFTNVEIGRGTSTLAAYTIPSDKIGVLLHYYVNADRDNGAAGAGTVSLRTRESGGSYISSRYEQVTTGSPIAPPLAGGIVMQPLTDLKVRIENVSDPGTSVSASFNLLLMDI